jgi:hypothetical protein
MTKRKSKKGQTMIYKTLLRKLKIEHQETGGESFFSGRVRCTIPAPLLAPVALLLFANNPVISHEWREGGIVITINGIYLW